MLVDIARGFFLVAALVTGCTPQAQILSPPVFFCQESCTEFIVDPEFTYEERAAIQSAIEEWRYTAGREIWRGTVVVMLAWDLSKVAHPEVPNGHTVGVYSNGTILILPSLEVGGIKEFRKIALHELGHAAGIEKHIRWLGDPIRSVMHASTADQPYRLTTEDLQALPR